MVTLTLLNGPDFTERLLHLKESWKRMIAAARKGNAGKERHGLIEWNKVAGSVRSFEVTNKGKGWHVHLHAFVLLKDYIDGRALSIEWKRFTGDSIIVDVRQCHGGIVPGLTEVLKYCSKLTELSNEQILHVWRCAKGSRFTDAQGILRGVPEPEIDQDDTTGLTGPTRDFYAIWGARMAYDFFPLATDSEPAAPEVLDLVQWHRNQR
jgi:hypothetical protein